MTVVSIGFGNGNITGVGGGIHERIFRVSKDNSRYDRGRENAFAAIKVRCCKVSREQEKNKPKVVSLR